MTEPLSINSDIFADMRSQFDSVLNSLVQLTEASDEAELTLKLKLEKEYSDDGEPELTERLKASWSITRTIKAKKYKVEGWITDDYIIQTDDAGKVYLQKVQISMFDDEEDIFDTEDFFEEEEEPIYENL